MKDILIVVSPSSHQDFEACKTMKTAVIENGGEAQFHLENTFLLSGPKSFQIAAALYDIADRKRLPVAVYEVKSVLHAPAVLSSKE